MTTIGVAVPSVPPRAGLLTRALTSVTAQSRYPDAISVTVDNDHQGAWATRNRAWRALDTDWVAFVDDDDELLPGHLERCLTHAETTGADLVYPWFDGPSATGILYIDGETPEGRLFDARSREFILTVGNFIPVTVLVRRSLLAEVDGFPQPGSKDWSHESCEDWGCWQRLLNAGAIFSHLPERTWLWHTHGGNTSGRSWSW